MLPATNRYPLEFEKVSDHAELKAAVPAESHVRGWFPRLHVRKKIQAAPGLEANEDSASIR